MSNRTFNFPIVVAGKAFIVHVTADVQAADPVDTTPPGQPAGLTADGSGGTSIVLNWNDNAEPDLAGYNVYRAFHATTFWVKLNTAGLVSLSAFTDSACDPDVSWDYYVSAVDVAGNESDGSGIANATRTGAPADAPPAAVQNLNATPMYDQVSLNWDDNTEPDLMGYRVYRADNAEGPYTLLSVLIVSTYDDTTLAAGAVGFYRITAIDNAAQESAAVDIAAERLVRPVGTSIPISSQATMSPATVHVHATPFGGQRYYKPNTTPTPGITLGYGNPLLTRYRWRFFEQDGVTPHGTYNDIEGFNVAHVFENAGTTAKKFVIALQVTQANGAVINATQQITVQPDRRTAVYCDGENAVAGAADPGDGTLANPFRTIKAAFAAVTRPDMKVLIARSSKKYPFDRTIIINQKNVLVEPYTPAAREPALPAHLEWVGAKSGFMIVFRGAENPTVRGLKITVANPIFNLTANIGLFNSDQGARNVTVQGLFIPEGLGGFWMQDIAPVVPPNGVFLLGNSMPHRSCSINFGYLVGANWVAIANQSIDPGQHCFRVGGADNVTALYNTFRRERPLEDTGVLSRGTITDHVGNYHYFAHNACSGGDMGTGPLTVGTNKGDRTRWVVFDSNTGSGIALSNSGHFGGIILHHGSEHVMIRNNYINNTNWRSLEIEGYSTEYARGVDDVYIYNNTFENPGTSGKALKLGGSATNLRFRNNLYIAPNLTLAGRPVEIVGDSMASFAASAGDTRKPIDRNIYPATILSTAFPQVAEAVTFLVNSGLVVSLATWNGYTQVGDDLGSNTAYQTQANGLNLKPVSNSQAATYGRPVEGVWQDFYGTARSRTATNWSAGCAQP